MISGFIPRTGRLAVLAFALTGLLAGCSGYSSLQSESYPKNLAYPQRQDLLFKDKPTTEPRKLSSPGQLEESLRAASKEPGAKTYNPADLDKSDALALRDALADVFGKPATPRIAPSKDSESFADYEAWQRVALSVAANEGFTNASALQDVFGESEAEATLARGSKLYRRHCLHCHGLGGAGRGPTAAWVHPHPRDYRSGQFKFMSTTKSVTKRKPRRADLVRVLHQGIDGTSMPAFGLLPEFELDYLTSYVIHLSLRGQVEFETMEKLLEKGGKENLKHPVTDAPISIADFVYFKTVSLQIDWARSNAEEPLPAPKYDEPDGDDKTKALHASITAGHQLFIGKAGCISCHTDYGRQVNYRFDVWGTLVRPANLTNSTYRGGRRPLDLYYRIKGGIEPAGMPAADNLSPAEYWQLINFVKSVPYPAMLPDKVRAAVYGASEGKKVTGHASAK